MTSLKKDKNQFPLKIFYNKNLTKVLISSVSTNHPLINQKYPFTNIATCPKVSSSCHNSISQKVKKQKKKNISTTPVCHNLHTIKHLPYILRRRNRCSLDKFYKNKKKRKERNLGTNRGPS